MSRLILICLSPFIFPVVALAILASDNTYEQAKGIFPSGQQDYCLDGIYRAKKSDKWLAMVRANNGLELQEALISESGIVKPKFGKAYWFIKNKTALLSKGAVTESRIKRIKTNNPRRTASSFRFNQKNWHWVEWGSDAQSFYLTDGINQWSSIDWPEPQSKEITISRVKVPAEYMANAPQPDPEGRDYQVGEYNLEWAGDLNNDGLLDFIVGWKGKETWGNHLWLGTKGKNGHLRFILVAEGNDGCS